MAHNPNVNYIYPQTNYYLEEPESYVADYSENEVISENQQILQTGPHTNITEIYTRKAAAMALQTQMIPNETRFRPKHYLQPCYCENAHQLTGTHIAVPIQNYNQTFEPTVFHQNCPISTTSQIDSSFDCNTYRSRSAHHNMAAAHHPKLTINYQDNTPHIQKQQNVKRYPVKVGTPKYYRKPPANAIFKRPSALCLPVASQPDPATTYRRPKKSTMAEPQYEYPQEISYTDDAQNGPPILLKEQSQPDLMAHKMDSEGDINRKISSLDEILSQFETTTEGLKPKSRCDLAKFARFMKPRVPSSIKEKHQKSKFKSSEVSEMVDEQFPDSTENDKNCTRLDMQEVPEDSLEKLLNQLKKCELEESFDKNEVKEDIRANLGNERRKDNSGHKNETNKMDVTDEECKKKATNKTGINSYNYQDITNQMLRSQSDSKSFEGSVNTTAHSSMQDITKRVPSTMSATASQKPKSFVAKPPLDDNCALELHRSKSYIVNLIDRALSKELGTIPSERCQKEFGNMNPRRAIDMMNRHASFGKTDDLCLEITSALTDSIISNATAPESRPTSACRSRNKLCCCGEEPTYIKQLKQLRWGHLKHIQREVRRLEDLERFLDSCSLNTISEF